MSEKARERERAASRSLANRGLAPSRVSVAFGVEHFDSERFVQRLAALSESVQVSRPPDSHARFPRFPPSLPVSRRPASLL